MVETDVHNDLVEARLMSRYNQQYSEIQNIPINKIMFFSALIDAEDSKTKHEIDKIKNKGKK